MKRPDKLLALFLVVALPVFLITSNVRWALNSVSLYEFGFTRYDVAQTTGLSQEQLSDAAAQIRDYFNSEDEELDLRVKSDQGTLELFNEREIQHMRDVKDLVKKTYRVQEGIFLYMFLFVAFGFFLQGSDFAGRLRKLLVRGSATTVGVVGTIGLVSLVAFGPLFRLFHELSFSNDFWMLDPARDRLVQMFPFGFWLETTLLIGAASIVESGAIVGLLLALSWWQARRRRVAQSKAPQYV